MRVALVVLMLATPLFGQYSGPAILSRGEAPAAMALPQIRFRPYVDILGTYDTGLAGVSVSSATGELGNASSFGAVLSYGIGGAHSWRHTRLGVDYHGSFSHYTRRAYYDGLNQSLAIELTHQFSPHIGMTLRESAGVFGRDFGLLGGLTQTVPFDPSMTYVPTTDYFDNRTIYSTTTAALTIQKTARLSFNMGGDAFVNKRRSDVLHSSTGLAAHGDTQYRLTRRSTIGALYGFYHFSYSHVLGSTVAHVAAGSYSWRLSRTTEISGFAGAARLESKFIETVAVDPVITALLGITSGTRLAHVIGYSPYWSVRISRAVPRGILYASAGRSFTPGNGLFLTSDMTNVMGGYSYTGLRRWSLSAQGVSSWANATGTITGNYNSVSGGLTASRTLGHGLHFLAAYDARRYDSPTYVHYNRVIHAARVGIGFAPGEVPLRIW